jgi:hypothetical protein
VGVVFFGFCEGAAEGGRLRRGCWPTAMSGGDLKALDRSVETLFVLFPICNLKNCNDLSKTR